MCILARFPSPPSPSAPAKNPTSSFSTMSDWFNSLAKSAQETVDYARKMAEEAAKMAEAEINAAKAQIEKEEALVKVEVEKTEVKGEAHLPWETDDEKLAILSEDVMERVKALSLNSKNFEIEPPLLDTFPFVFSENVATAMRLLQLDENLAKMHAKLSLKMNEEVFWHHYFFRIKYIRLKLGMEKIKPLEIKGNPLTKIKKLAEDDVLFKPIVVAPKPTTTSTSSSSKPTPSSSSSQTTSGTTSTVGIDGGGMDSSANEGEKIVSKEAMEARRKREAALEAEIDAEMENDLDFDIDIDLDGVNVDDMGDFDVELDIGGDDTVNVTKKATPSKTTAPPTSKTAAPPTTTKKTIVPVAKSSVGKDNLDDEIEREIELELKGGAKKK